VEQKLNLLARAIDSVVSTFWPKSGLQRKAARDALFHFESAGTHRLKKTRNEDWDVSGDSTLDSELEDLRGLSREFYANSAIYRGLIKRSVDNIVESGFTFQMQTENENLNREVEAYMKEWAERCDVRGLFSFGEIQRKSIEAEYNEGDVCYIKTDHGLLQPMEADQLCTPAEFHGDPAVYHGVRVNATGRPVAFYFCPYRPLSEGGGVDDTKYREVPADVVLHHFAPDRFSHSRGYPGGSSIFRLLELLDKFIEAVVVGARIAACQGVYIKSPFGGGAAVAHSTGSITDDSGNKFPLEQLYPGVVAHGDGEVTQLKPEQPSQQFPPFITMMLRLIGSPFGMPLELVLLDFSKTNYSSTKASINQACVTFRSKQSNLTNRILNPVTEWKLDHFFRDNPRWANIPRNRVYSWEAPGREMLDILKEAEGSAMVVMNSLSTLKREGAKNNYYWTDLLDQRFREIAYAMDKAEKELGDKDLWKNVIPHLQVMDIKSEQPMEPQGGKGA
jgi:lambda family phage portal protein